MNKKLLMKRLFLFVLLILAMYPLYHKALGPVDDAYITSRFSYMLAHGNGIVFNPGEKIEGCTAFGMMILLAIPSLLGMIDIVRVGQLLGILSWAGVLVLVWSILRKDDTGKPPLRHVFSIAYLVGGLVGLCWVYSGMEPPIVALLWLGAVYMHFHEDRTGKLPIASALLTVAAGLMRPDGILIAVPIGLSTLLPLSKKRFIRATISSVIVLGIFGSYWLWRWHYFGYLVPNTFYAKVGQSSFTLMRMGLYYIIKGLIATMVPLLTLFMLPKLAIFRKDVDRETWVVAFTCIMGLGYLLYTGGDFFPFQRFFVPVLAFWVILFNRLLVLGKDRMQPIGFDDAEGETPVAKKPWPRWAVWTFAIVAVFVINVIAALPQGQGSSQQQLVRYTREWGEVGKVLKKSVPEGTAIATIPIGALGYWSDRYILDMLGLIDLHIAHLKLPTGLRVVGHEKHDTKYVLGRKPELVMMWPVFVKPTLREMIFWNQNTLLSVAQEKMIDALRGNPDYITRAMPIPHKRETYVLAAVRADLIDQAPYNTWKPIGKETERIIYADNIEVREFFKAMRKGNINAYLERNGIHVGEGLDRKMF